jgi:hypothetical protein
MGNYVSQVKIERAAEILKQTYLEVLHETEFQNMFAARDSVIGRYQKVFSPEHLPDLTKEGFQDFLKFENNQHWRPLFRQQAMITENMDELRKALIYLVDESIPLEKRLEKLRPKGGEPWIKGLSKAIITPILLISQPDKFGVWNGVSENGMKTVGVWPPIKTTAPFSEKYLAINEILLELSVRLELDLWTLDGLWWGVKQVDHDAQTAASTSYPAERPAELPRLESAHEFGMERYLQDFISDNWDQIADFKDWGLFEDEDEIVGVEYNTGEVGRIDLLAKHKSNPEWLVIELKRDQASDQTMGQVQRYMGWVQHNLAGPDDRVHGLIIAKSISQQLSYALESVDNIDFMTYRINFSLKKE